MIKKIFFLIFNIFLALTSSFALENKKADAYKTHETSDKNSPVVYFIRDITAESLVKVYKASGSEIKIRGFNYEHKFKIKRKNCSDGRTGGSGEFCSGVCTF